MAISFTDIHHHLVYSVDDGPEAFHETEAMLRAAIRDRIGKIIATPHVVPGIEAFDLESFLWKLERIQLFCLREQLALEVFPGAEIFYTRFTRRLLDERRVPTLDGTDYILVEFSPVIGYEEIKDAVESLNRGGYIPILAHVERYRCLVGHPKRAYELKNQLNVRYQVNCTTIVHGKGFLVNRFCERLLRGELVDAVATDAHNVDTRPVLMMKAWRVLEKQVGTRYAARLTGMDGEFSFL